MHPGFLHWRRARGCAHHGVQASLDGGFHAAGRHHGHGHGPALGVRRPLRVMSHELDLDDEQVESLARIIDELNNPYLNGHLRSTLDRKLDLLRRAAMLPKVS